MTHIIPKIELMGSMRKKVGCSCCFIQPWSCKCNRSSYLKPASRGQLREQFGALWVFSPGSLHRAADRLLCNTASQGWSPPHTATRALSSSSHLQLSPRCFFVAEGKMNLPEDVCLATKSLSWWMILWTVKQIITGNWKGRRRENCIILMSQKAIGFQR